MDEPQYLDINYNVPVQIRRLYGVDNEYYNGTLISRVGGKVWFRDDKYGDCVILLNKIQVLTQEFITLEALRPYLDDVIVATELDKEMLDKIKRGEVPNLAWTGKL